jgi:hypothetical protein
MDVKLRELLFGTPRSVKSAQVRRGNESIEVRSLSARQQREIRARAIAAAINQPEELTSVTRRLSKNKRIEKKTSITPVWDVSGKLLSLDIVALTNSTQVSQFEFRTHQSHMNRHSRNLAVRRTAQGRTEITQNNQNNQDHVKSVTVLCSQKFRNFLARQNESCQNRKTIIDKGQSTPSIASLMTPRSARLAMIAKEFEFDPQARRAHYPQNALTWNFTYRHSGEFMTPEIRLSVKMKLDAMGRNAQIYLRKWEEMELLELEAEKENDPGAIEAISWRGITRDPERRRMLQEEPIVYRVQDRPRLHVKRMRTML